MTFGDRETGRTQNYSQWRMCDSAHAGYQRLDHGTLNDPGKDSLSKEIQRCLHDPHGRSFHPSGRLGLLPAQDATRYAPVPLRALLSRLGAGMRGNGGGRARGDRPRAREALSCIT